MAGGGPEIRSEQSRVIREIDRISTERAKDASGGCKGQRVSLIMTPLGEFFRTLVTPSHGGVVPEGRIVKAVNAWAMSFVTEAKKYEIANSDPERPKRESVDFK